MISWHKTPVEIAVCDVKNHIAEKANVLSAIAKHGTHSKIIQDQRISNTDWHLQDLPRSYWNDYVFPLVNPVVVEFLQGLRSEGLELNAIYPNFWFQQYEPGDFHGWHLHPGTMYNGVYFVELEGEVQTEFSYRGARFTVPVSEGQVVLFPSTLLHRSPPNTSNSRKTSVAFNINIDTVVPE